MNLTAIIKLLTLAIQLIHSLLDKRERKLHELRVKQIKDNPRQAFRDKFTRKPDDGVLSDADRAEINGGVQPPGTEPNGSGSGNNTDR